MRHSLAGSLFPEGTIGSLERDGWISGGGEGGSVVSVFAWGVVAGVDDLLLLRWQRGSGLARVWWTAQDSGRDKPRGWARVRQRKLRL